MTDIQPAIHSALEQIMQSPYDGMDQPDRIEAKLDRIIQVMEILAKMVETIEPQLERIGPLVDAVQEHPMVRMIIKRAEKKAGN